MTKLERDFHFDREIGQTNWIFDSLHSCAALRQLLVSNPPSQVRRQSERVSKLARQVLELPPLFRQNYFSQIPSLFLHQIQNYDRLNSFPFILARDGSRILELIKRDLLKSGAGIAIAHGLRENRDQLVYRTVERVQFDNRKTPKSFLIAGCTHFGFCNLQDAKDLVQRTITRFSLRQLRGVGLRVYIESPMTIPKSNRLGLSGYLYKVAAEIGFKSIEFVNAAELPPYGSSDGVCYLELNSRNLVADSYLKHQVFSQGGGSMKDEFKIALRRSSYIEQSPFHGFEIGLIK